MVSKFETKEWLTFLSLDYTGNTTTNKDQTTVPDEESVYVILITSCNNNAVSQNCNKIYHRQTFKKHYSLHLEKS
jgi:hypothetical protein